jgi:uncharacterized protein YecE (DUF72 family)
VDERLQALQSLGIYFGTSSWKYEGWQGWLYRKPYRTKKHFNETCLAEYAEYFPAVGVDHTYYTWPQAEMFERYAAQTPDTFRFGLKATERVTVYRFPSLKRYGKDAGLKNEGFLDSALFREQFLRPLDAVAHKLAPILFEFSPFHPGTLPSGRDFVRQLEAFFESLKQETRYRFAVEIRNRAWLQGEYFEALARQGVSHVFNSWTRMPPLNDQLDAASAYTLPALVSRVLLQPGTKYEDAVEAFSPYDKVIEEQPLLRQAVARLVRRAVDLKLPAYIFVNNRAEGCAPRTIDGVLEILQQQKLFD